MSGPNNDTKDFEAFYAPGRQWSGDPNESLVREVTPFQPGTALDIGSGEGADVIWLAQRGWQTVGLDASATAARRTRELIDDRDLSDRAEVLLGGITAVEKRQFDLVLCFYVPFSADDRVSVPAIEKLVAPGGHLLWVHHEGHSHPVLSPAQVAEQLADLDVVRLGTHLRTVAGGPNDEVLLAQRTA